MVDCHVYTTHRFLYWWYREEVPGSTSINEYVQSYINIP